HAQPEDTHELLRKLLEDLQVINEELAEYINSPSWNCPAFYNDVDDDEYSIQVSEFLKKSPIAIASVLPTEEPDNSLNTSIVSSPKIDSLLEEFAGELAHIDPIPPGIDETDFDPKDDIRFIEQLLYDDTLSEEDSFEYIDYVEASPPDSELVSLEEDDDVAWWVDSIATIHVCKDRCWFKTYESLDDGYILHIGNESTTLIHGHGCVDLSFSSGKIVSLFNVLHVPNIRNNLVSSGVLNNCGYKQVIESNEFLLSKHAFTSTSKLNDLILWHARLGHVHFKKMQDMSKDGLISALDMDTKKWNKKYFVTFSDDALRF
nr:zinc finger, CCHC-type [Tanacetum cinerariifolium]